MTKRKAVTISVTSAEFHYINFAVNEYLEFSGGSYDNCVETSFDSFQKKYWRAIIAQKRREVSKSLKEQY